jgi:hypothetical protein
MEKGADFPFLRNLFRAPKAAQEPPNSALARRSRDLRRKAKIAADAGVEAVEMWARAERRPHFHSPSQTPGSSRLEGGRGTGEWTVPRGT